MRSSADEISSQPARMVVRHYAAKGYGPRKIRDELYRRGVPREFWEDAMGRPASLSPSYAPSTSRECSNAFFSISGRSV